MSRSFEMYNIFNLIENPIRSWRSKDQDSSWWRGIVVITFRLHRKDPEFDPQRRLNREILFFGGAI